MLAAGARRALQRKAGCIVLVVLLLLRVKALHLQISRLLKEQHAQQMQDVISGGSSNTKDHVAGIFNVLRVTTC